MNDATEKANEILNAHDPDQVKEINPDIENKFENLDNQFVEVPGQEKEQSPQDPQINGDLDLDYIVFKLKEKKNEMARLKKLRDEKVEVINASYEHATKSLRQLSNYFKSIVESYIRDLHLKPMRSGTIKYKVLSGTVYIKKQSPTITRDDEGTAYFNGEALDFLDLEERDDKVEIK